MFFSVLVYVFIRIYSLGLFIALMMEEISCYFVFVADNVVKAQYLSYYFCCSIIGVNLMCLNVDCFLSNPLQCLEWSLAPL